MASSKYPDYAVSDFYADDAAARLMRAAKFLPKDWMDKADAAHSKGNMLEIPSPYDTGPGTAPTDTVLKVGLLRSGVGDGGIDPRLIRAIINKESGGKSDAVGKKGERGLMQIMPDTARRLGYAPADMLNPDKNVAAGKKLLGMLLTKYHGDIYKTLAAYNAGEKAVDSGNIPASTQRYVQGVMQQVAQQGGVTSLQRLQQAPFTEEGPQYYKQAYERNQLFAKPGPYFTQLSPQDEQQFRGWLKTSGNPSQFDPDAKITDYDMRGYWKDVASQGRNLSGINQSDMRLHFPDTYKTPYDTTFSGESRYAQPNLPLKWVDAGIPGKERLVNTQTGQVLYQARPKATPTATPTPISRYERFQSAFSPGVAFAGEEPSVDDIERDKARRRAAAAAAVAPAAAPTPAGPGGPAGPPAPPDEANAPFAVKAAGYLPFIGQPIGEYGAGAAAMIGSGGTAWPAESAIMGAGGATGYGAGELINRGVRRAYGYPNPPWSTEAENIGEAGLYSAASVPIFRGGKWIFSPSTARAGLKAREGFSAAEKGVEQLSKKVEQTLGVGRNEAKVIAQSSSVVKQMPHQAEKMLEHIETKVPPARQAGALKALREVLATYIHEAAMDIQRAGGTVKEELEAMRLAIRKIPERVFLRLYNGTREEIQELIDTTLEQHGKWLKYDTLRQAVRTEVDTMPPGMKDRVLRHFGWLLSPFGLAISGLGAGILHAGGFIGNIGEAVLVSLPMLLSSELANSPPVRKLYVRLLLSQNAAQAARIARSLFPMLASMMFTSPAGSAGAQGDLRRSEPAPAPEAEATPSAAPPAARGAPPPPPPPDRTLEIPPMEPSAAPTPSMMPGFSGSPMPPDPEGEAAAARGGTE